MRRPLEWYLRAPLEGRHYLAVANTFRFSARPLPDLARYLLGVGGYPYVSRVRTPCGSVSIELTTPDDAITVNEVFFREDYAVPLDVRFVIDIGANIGVSALYFLSRNPRAACRLYEPDSRNVARLRSNLAGYEDRYTLYEQAVADVEGEFDFGIESTGRYGGIGVETGETIRVSTRDVNSVLEDALAEWPEIDALKIDTEGLEVKTVRSIRPDLLARVNRIFFEHEHPVENPHPELFTHTRRGWTERLVRRPTG